MLMYDLELSCIYDPLVLVHTSSYNTPVNLADQALVDIYF